MKNLFSKHLLLVCANTNDLFMLTLYSVISSSSFINSSSWNCSIFGIFYINNHILCSRAWFTSSFLIFVPFLWMNTSSKYGHLHFNYNFMKKSFSFSSLTLDVSCKFFRDVPYWIKSPLFSCCWVLFKNYEWVHLLTRTYCSPLLCWYVLHLHWLVDC